MGFDELFFPDVLRRQKKILKYLKKLDERLDRLEQYVFSESRIENEPLVITTEPEIKEPVKRVQEVEEVVEKALPREQEYILIQEPKKELEQAVQPEIINGLKTKKKDLIKEKILEKISSKELSTIDVKEFIVDKKKFCSKATFYRYVSELKRAKKLQTLVVNDKEFLYIMKTNEQ